MPEEDEECNNCGFPTELKSYQSGIPQQEFRLCDVCASTHLSKATTYPRQVEDGDLYKSIAYIANMILQKLEDNKCNP